MTNCQDNHPENEKRLLCAIQEVVESSWNARTDFQEGHDSDQVPTAGARPHVEAAYERSLFSAVEVGVEDGHRAN